MWQNLLTFESLSICKICINSQVIFNAKINKIVKIFDEASKHLSGPKMCQDLPKFEILSQSSKISILWSYLALTPKHVKGVQNELIYQNSLKIESVVIYEVHNDSQGKFNAEFKKESWKILRTFNIGECAQNA